MSKPRQAAAAKARASNSLTPKQEKFCLTYMEIGNASEAYRRSYSCENTTDKSVNELSCRLLNQVNISSRVAELKAIHLKKHMVTVDRVLLEYSRLAFLDIRKAFDVNGNLKALVDLDDETAAAVAGIEFEEVFEGRGDGRSYVGRIHKIKLSDKLGALNSLGKHLAMFTDKVELGGPNGGAIQTQSTVTVEFIRPVKAIEGGDL